MNRDIYGFIALCAFAFPFIAGPILIGYKIFRKFRPSKEVTQIEKQPERKLAEPSTLPKPASAQWAVLNFIAATIICVLASSLVGMVISVFSNLMYIVFVFPLVMGLANGGLLTDGMQRMKIRKTYQLIFISVLMAVATYGTYHYGRYIGLQVQTSLQMFPGLSAATEDENLRVAKIVVDYAVEEKTGHSGFVGYMLFMAQEGVSISRFYHSSRLNLGPILTWFYWILEFGIILGITISMGKKQAGMPFCEVCGNWYGKEKHLGGTTPANESLLLDLLKQKDFIELGRLIEQNAELPSMEIYFQGCEICKKSNSFLVVRHAFRNSKGVLQFTDAAQISLQPRDSMLLLNQSRLIRN